MTKQTESPKCLGGSPAGADLIHRIRCKREEAPAVVHDESRGGLEDRRPERVKDALDQTHCAPFSVGAHHGNGVALRPTRTERETGCRRPAALNGVTSEPRNTFAPQKIIYTYLHEVRISEEESAVGRGEAKQFRENSRIATEWLAVGAEGLERAQNLEEQKTLTVGAARPNVPLPKTPMQRFFESRTESSQVFNVELRAHFGESGGERAPEFTTVEGGGSVLSESSQTSSERRLELTLRDADHVQVTDEPDRFGYGICRCAVRQILVRCALRRGAQPSVFLSSISSMARFC